MAEIEVGVVHNYYDKIAVVAIEITNDELSIGDGIHIKGHTTDYKTTIKSMQIEHQSVEKAKKGDMVGIKLEEKVRRHDKVYKITE